MAATCALYAGFLHTYFGDGGITALESNSLAG